MLWMQGIILILEPYPLHVIFGLTPNLSKEKSDDEVWTWTLLPPPHFSVWTIRILGVLTSSVPYVSQQVMSDRCSHLQLPEVLQVVEGSLGNHSDLRLLNYPVDTENSRSHDITSNLSNTLISGMYSLMGNPERSLVASFCCVSGTARPARPWPVTHSCWGFSLHARSKLFFCTECLHMIPSLIRLWSLEMTWTSFSAHL